MVGRGNWARWTPIADQSTSNSQQSLTTTAQQFAHAVTRIILPAPISRPVTTAAVYPDLFQLLGDVIEFLLGGLHLSAGDLHDFGVHRLHPLLDRAGSRLSLLILCGGEADGHSETAAARRAHLDGNSRYIGVLGRLDCSGYRRNSQW